MTFRFIGSECQIAEAWLRELGQSVELTEARAAEVIQRGAILPNSIFMDLGFTPEELKTYKYPGSRADASEEFKEKYRAALLALHAIRERVAAGHGFEEAGHGFEEKE